MRTRESVPVVMRWVDPRALGGSASGWRYRLFGAAFRSARIGYAAHLGGALAGVVWWLVERSRASAPDPKGAAPGR